MQGTARLPGQTAGSVIMALLFTLTSSTLAPRLSLAVSAVLALAGGTRQRAADRPRSDTATVSDSLIDGPPRSGSGVRGRPA